MLCCRAIEYKGHNLSLGARSDAGLLNARALQQGGTRPAGGFLIAEGKQATINYISVVLKANRKQSGDYI